MCLSCPLTSKECHDVWYRKSTSIRHFEQCNQQISKLICQNCGGSTVDPRYNEVLGTIKITLLYQVSHYIRVKKQRNIKRWDQQNYLVIRGFVKISGPLYNVVPLLHVCCPMYFDKRKHVPKMKCNKKIKFIDNKTNHKLVSVIRSTDVNAEYHDVLPSISNSRISVYAENLDLEEEHTTYVD